MKIADDKRVVLRKAELRNLAFQAKRNLKLTWLDFGEAIGINDTTLRESYLKGNRTISYGVFLKLCKFAGIEKKNEK